MEEIPVKNFVAYALGTAFEDAAQHVMRIVDSDDTIPYICIYTDLYMEPGNTRTAATAYLVAGGFLEWMRSLGLIDPRVECRVFDRGSVDTLARSFFVP